VYSNRGLLRWAALFLGELRDGLTMINMQSAFLIVSKHYTEKQAGVLFFGTNKLLCLIVFYPPFLYLSLLRYLLTSVIINIHVLYFYSLIEIN
jgi:hypothetical protein